MVNNQSLLTNGGNGFAGLQMFNEFEDPHGMGMGAASFMDNPGARASFGGPETQSSLLGNGMAEMGMNGLGFGDESMGSMNMGMGMIPPDLFSMPMTFEWDWGDANLGNMGNGEC